MGSIQVFSVHCLLDIGRLIFCLHNRSRKINMYRTIFHYSLNNSVANRETQRQDKFFFISHKIPYFATCFMLNSYSFSQVLPRAQQRWQDQAQNLNDTLMLCLAATLWFKWKLIHLVFSSYIRSSLKTVMRKTNQTVQINTGY